MKSLQIFSVAKRSWFHVVKYPRSLSFVSFKYVFSEWHVISAREHHGRAPPPPVGRSYARRWSQEDITIMHRCRSRSVCRTSMSILVECRRHRSESVVVSSNSNSYPTIPYLIVVSRNNQQLHPHKNHQNDIKPWLLEAAATPLRLLRYLRCRGSARLVSLCSSTHILDTCLLLDMTM